MVIKEILMDQLGKDVSDLFVDERVHVHGTIAYNMLAKHPLSFFHFYIILCTHHLKH